ncbi:hypothetical protein P9C27_18960 [Bacillus vallismortis]|uniref:hypothetical protein n=1 Tax=Bacillus vallismortis TaxID=72361 RepID=UPI002DBC5AEF|nr:hypothetical protein [Bacillus vallismortis]MEC1270546.1 hypothetical protein [Bacillus vallismortis]
MGAYYIIEHVETKTTKSLIVADSAQDAYKCLERGYYDEFDSEIKVETHVSVKEACTPREKQLLLIAPQEEDSNE